MIIPHSKTYFDEEESIAITKVLKSGFVSMGERVSAFEDELCKLTGKRYAICVDSGFSALRLSLMALGITEGDKVGLPAYSCVALINAVLSVRAIPVPIDNFSENNTLDVRSVDTLEKLNAIIVVHTFGEPVDIKHIRTLTTALIIEDCAHALGTKLYGHEGDIVITSFYATKLLGVGEGGALLTNDPIIYSKLSQWRSYIDQPPDGSKFNNKMTDIEAAIGLCQLEKLEKNIQKRTELAINYHKELEELKAYKAFVQPTISHKVWYRYVINVPEYLLDKLRDYLREKGVHAERPVETWGANQFSSKALENTKSAYLQNLSLPLYPALSTEEQSLVIKSIKDFFYEYARL